MFLPSQEKGFLSLVATETDPHRGEVEGRGGDHKHGERLRQTPGGHY